MTDQPVVDLVLSEDAMWALSSAANEATIFGPEERARVGAADHDLAEAMSDSAHRYLDEPPQRRHTWSVPSDWIPAVSRLIPNAVAVLGDEEMEIRSSMNAAMLRRAQNELREAMRSAGYDQ